MAKVPTSTGQGTSRKAYQTAYRQGMRGTGASASGDFKPLRGESGGTASGSRGYGKDSGFQPPKNQPFLSEHDPDLVPFGVSNLKTLEGFLPGKPPRKGKGFT